MNRPAPRVRTRTRPSACRPPMQTISPALPPRYRCTPRRGIILGAILLSSSQILAFVPSSSHRTSGQKHHRPKTARNNSRLPRVLSFQGPDNPSNPVVLPASFPPPSASTTNNGKDGSKGGGNDEQSLSSAKATLEARTKEIETLRKSQSEQLAQISDLTASLASAHGDTEKAQTGDNLMKSQTVLSQSLENVAKLIAEANDASVRLIEMEKQRMEAVTALEEVEQSSDGSDKVLKEVVNGAAADKQKISVPETLEAEEEEEEEAVVDDDKVNGESSVAEDAVQLAELMDWKLDGVCATGRVYNHPSIGDGDVIVTSALTNPGDAREGEIVITESGSQYKLGTPQLNTGGQMGTASWEPLVVVDDIDIDAPSYFAVPTLDLDLAKTRLELTGESVGDGRYLLAGSPIISKHGRSEIWSAYRANGYGLPKGEPLCVKLSNNMEAMSREDGNYRAVTSGRNNRGRFVKHFEFIPAAASYGDKAALIMERGTGDLKGFVEQIGALEGGLLRDAVSAAVQCVQAVHNANLVWTDLKAENFVVVEERGGTVGFRGIDLESAMPKDGNPVDYSPEACPPEFAEAFLADGGQSFILDPSYDIWSLGTLIYELAMGEALFEGMSPLDITKTLPSYQPGDDVFGAIPDEKLADMVRQCLQVDPSSRPTIDQLAKHPYLPSGLNALFRGFGQ